MVWIPLVCLVLFLLDPTAVQVLAESEPSGKPDVVTEIRRALSGRSDLSHVSRYLELSHTELLSTLTPNNNKQADGPGSKNSYTFFAPINWAFVSLLPQDTWDPFTVDAEFRQEILLRHFVQNQLSDQDFTSVNGGTITMADGTQLSVSQKEGVTRINGSLIGYPSIKLREDFGIVYVVDGVFTTQQAVIEALKKNPVNQTPWGPIQGGNPGVEQESATVVVDLIAEYLAG